MYLDNKKVKTYFNWSVRKSGFLKYIQYLWVYDRGGVLFLKKSSVDYFHFHKFECSYPSVMSGLQQNFWSRQKNCFPFEGSCVYQMHILNIWIYHRYPQTENSFSVVTTNFVVNLTLLMYRSIQIYGNENNRLSSFWEKFNLDFWEKIYLDFEISDGLKYLFRAFLYPEFQKTVKSKQRQPARHLNGSALAGHIFPLWPVAIWTLLFFGNQDINSFQVKSF